MKKTADSYRFISGVSKRMIKSWIKLESPREVPWTPISKPLSDCTVALISTGGIALKSDKPFDQEREHRNPWWGDPSYRIIPHRTNTANIRVYHMHIDQRPAEKDMNCLLPSDRLKELVEMGGSAERPHRIIRSWDTFSNRQSFCIKASPRSSSVFDKTKSTWQYSYLLDRSAAGPLDWHSERSNVQE
jgi:hypothetical protein